MKPLVSILIPCHNAEPWVALTLESALAQTHPACEIIVVNDGSTDGSRGILRQYEARGVTVIDQPNAGQSAAFNRALSAARGDYYEFLDADDLLAPDKIAAQVAMASTLPAERMLSGSWGRFHADPAEARFEAGANWAPYLDPVEWLVTTWSANHMMHGAAWLVPAPLVRRAGGWNTSLSLINDFEFFARLLLASDGVSFCPGARSYYRSGLPGSLSGRKSDAAWDSAFRSIELGTGHLLQRENSPHTRMGAARAFEGFYYDAFPAVPALRRKAARRIRELGGNFSHAPGGRRFKLLAKCISWPLARRLQLALRRLAGKSPLVT